MKVIGFVMVVVLLTGCTGRLYVDRLPRSVSEATQLFAPSTCIKPWLYGGLAGAGAGVWILADPNDDWTPDRLDQFYVVTGTTLIGAGLGGVLFC